MLSTFTYYFVAYFSIYKNSLIFRRKILTNILGLNFLQNSPKISTCSETLICLFILAERRERSEFIVSSRAKRARSQHVNRALVLVAANLDAPSFFEYIAWCPPNDVLQRDGKKTLLYYCLIFFLTAVEKRFAKRNMNKEQQNDYKSNRFKTRTQLGFRNQENYGIWYLKSQSF